MERQPGTEGKRRKENNNNNKNKEGVGWKTEREGNTFSLVWGEKWKKIYGEVEVGWEKAETNSFFLERKRNEALVVLSGS